MTDYRRGWAIEWLGINNPAGLVVGHLFRETGLVRKQVAEELEVRQSHLSGMIAPEGIGPSFETNVGPKLVEVLAREELARVPHLLWPSERANPGRRAKLIHDGLLLLSLWTPKSANGGKPYALFSQVAELTGFAHDAAMRLLAEAIWGSLKDTPKARIVPKPSSPNLAWLTRSALANEVNFRRELGRYLALVDAWRGPEDLLAEVEGARTARAANDLREAILAAGSAIENAEEERRRDDDAA